VERVILGLKDLREIQVKKVIRVTLGLKVLKVIQD
jgi:hypothetical protein